MNKFINILLLLIIFPVLAYTIFVGFDLPIEFLKTSGANTPYKTEIFSTFALIILIISTNRSVKRWLGLKMVNQIKKFQWNVEMNKERYNQVILYLILESFIHLFLGLSLYKIANEALPLTIVLLLFSLDHLVLAILGKNKNLFRIGLTSKAILTADREVKAIYFTGLRTVSFQQKSLFFDYSNNLQLTLSSDSIPKDERMNFKLALEKNINRDRVFFDESFKEFN
jgi:hypothetical protein